MLGLGRATAQGGCTGGILCELGCAAQRVGTNGSGSGCSRRDRRSGRTFGCRGRRECRSGGCRRRSASDCREYIAYFIVYFERISRLFARVWTAKQVTVKQNQTVTQSLPVVLESRNSVTSPSVQILSIAMAFYSQVSPLLDVSCVLGKYPLHRQQRPRPIGSPLQQA